MNRYFYDSYAVLAYLSDHPGYHFYFERCDGILTKLNFMEVHHKILSEYGIKAARKALDTFLFTHDGEVTAGMVTKSFHANGLLTVRAT